MRYCDKKRTEIEKEMISPWYIVYYILSSLAILSNGHVLRKIIVFKMYRSETTQLIFYLHISSMILNIATIPYAYTGNLPICEMMRAFHYYGGLANILVLCFLTYVYRNFTFNQTTSNDFVENYAAYFVFGLPVITLLPFSTDSYDGSTGPWCVLGMFDIESQVWVLVMFYFWAALAIVICAITFGYLFAYAQQHDQNTGKRLFQSVGLYIIISWFTLLPRCIHRFVALFVSDSIEAWVQFITLGPIPLGGILYALVFYSNYQMYRRYSHHHSSSASSKNVISLENISWKFSFNSMFGSVSSKHVVDLLRANQEEDPEALSNNSNSNSTIDRGEEEGRRTMQSMEISTDRESIPNPLYQMKRPTNNV